MHSKPERVAWITMIGALAIFCLLCISTVIFAQWLVFESPTQLNVTLYVSRGTVGVAEPDTSDEKAVRAMTSVARDDRVSTDVDAQGYLAVSDPYSNDTLATFTLFNDSAITVSGANRPRFNWSDNPYTVRLAGFTGQMDVWVREDLDRQIDISIESAIGSARISDSGQYSIEQTPGGLRVTVQAGASTLIALDGQAQHLAAETEGIIQVDNPVIRVNRAPVSLLTNSRFEEVDESNWPVGWICGFSESPEFPNAPRGEWEFANIDGRASIHITRMQENPGAGRTGCYQVLVDPVNGLDVSEYDTLKFRVTMQVHHQQLSACGSAGSECPIMLYMEYWDQYDSGVKRGWYHGFYADYTPGVGRTRCDSCYEEHERINKDAWYTYESENLFTLLPEGLRPGAITRLEFYAEGHQYEVMLSEVSLLATSSQPAGDVTIAQ